MSKCGGMMKIIGFVEARQDEVIRKILEHCGLWHDPPPKPVRTLPESDTTNTVEMDPDVLDHLRHESMSDQLELPWEP